MKATIIGGNSFLAKHIQQLLPKEGYCSLTKSSEPRYSFPETPVDSLKKNDLDSSSHVIYCAGAGVQPGHQDTDDLIYAMNYHEPKRLIELLNEIGYTGQLITFGSYFEIGITSVPKLYTELDLIEHHNSFPNAYTRSKNQFTRFASEQWARGNSFRHVHFILTNIYGVGENKQRLLPYLARQFKTNQPIELTSGEQVRQYTHVRNVANFIVGHVLPSKASGVFNLSNPKTTQVKEVVMKFCEVAKADPTLISFAKAERPDTAMPHLALATNLTTTVFGPFNWMPIEEGMREYMQ